MYEHLKKQDPAIYKAIVAETKRQEEGLELIPSEIAASAAVIEALGSVLDQQIQRRLSSKKILRRTGKYRYN